MRLLLALALLLVFSNSVGAVDNQLGGKGLGFSCDILTAQCKCQGDRDGADCKAMKKNCVDQHIPGCFIDANGRPNGCQCKMALRAGQQGIKVAPTQLAPTRKIQ
jgi:hypothetical protein